MISFYLSYIRHNAFLSITFFLLGIQFCRSGVRLILYIMGQVRLAGPHNVPAIHLMWVMLLMHQEQLVLAYYCLNPLYHQKKF